MTSIAASERRELCVLAQRLGPDAPTLCGEWTVKDLVVHLLLRERSAASVGMLAPVMSGVLERAAARRGEQEFASLVDQLRNGPPLYSPFRLPRVGAKLNLLEFYVHHEDVRRAQALWEPRSLPRTTEDGIWGVVRVAGRALAARCDLGIVAERSDTGEQATVRKGVPEVTVRGLPSEVTLYLHGRKDQARVELLGAAADVAALEKARLGY